LRHIRFDFSCLLYVVDVWAALRTLWTLSSYHVIDVVDATFGVGFDFSFNDIDSE